MSAMCMHMHEREGAKEGMTRVLKDLYIGGRGEATKQWQSAHGRCRSLEFLGSKTGGSGDACIDGAQKGTQGPWEEWEVQVERSGNGNGSILFSV